MQICNHDISKSITARSFKLGQLIEGDKWINWWKFKKKLLFFFSNYLPLQIWAMKICNHDILKSVTARSFKLGQLIECDKWIDWLKALKKLLYFFFELSIFADLGYESLYSWYLEKYHS